MTLCEDVIEESGAARIIQHIQNGVAFIMISAMRASLPKAENMQRTKRLSHILNGLPVSSIHTEGEYWEDGAEAPSRELSFFVMSKNKAGEIAPDALRKIGIKLMHTFEQDAILYGDGQQVNLIESDGTQFGVGDNATFDLGKIASLPGFSSVKNKKFSFTDEPTRVAYARP